MVDGQTVPREPKYYTVKRHLLDYVVSLEAGASVPAERDLATEFLTSRTTVRQAVNELVAEGRLVRRHGSGTYVAHAKITWPLHLASFTEQAAANGLTASSRFLGSRRIRASDDLAQQLGLAVGDPICQIDRLRLADEQPMAVETSLLSARRFPRLGTRMRSALSLHAVVMNDYGVDLRRGEESIETSPATVDHAQLLETDVGSPMLVVRRRSFDTAGTPVEWGTSWFRGDRITLTANLLTPRVATRR